MTLYGVKNLGQRHVMACCRGALPDVTKPLPEPIAWRSIIMCNNSTSAGT